jgi:hypothetical protein
MAIETSATILSALAQTYAKKYHPQFNRAARFLSLIDTVQEGGKNVAWTNSFSGATAGSYAEGADLVSGDFTSDVKVASTLSWGLYRTSFWMSDHEIEVAQSAGGSADAMMGIFETNLREHIAKIASQLNNDAINATGTDGSSNPCLQGILSACQATGTYAGVARATYPEFAGNVLANGAVGRALTLNLMQQAEDAIFNASGGHGVDFILTDAAMVSAYAAILETRRVFNDNSGTLNAYPKDDGSFFKGVPIVRDVNMPRASGLGSLVFVNKDAVKLVALPPTPCKNAQASFVINMATGMAADGTLQDSTGIPLRVCFLGKTGDSTKVMIRTAVQMKVTNPNRIAVLKDIT